VVSAQLVASVHALPATAFAGRAFRHQPARYDPLSGRGARSLGGRWNPPGNFSVLYLGLDEATVSREFRRHAARQGRALSDFLPRTLYGYDVEAANLVDLRDSGAASAVGLEGAAFGADDLRPCQRVGEAAQHAGREGILAPSAAGSGPVLALFLDSVKPGSSIAPHALGTWDVPGDVEG